MTDPIYHCELLSNIRQISVSISSPCTPIKTIQLHPSRRALRLTYANNTTSHILLPASADLSAPTTLPPLLSHRLPAAKSHIDSGELCVPWTARILTSETSLHC